MGEYFSFIGIDFWTALFTLLNFLAVFFVGKHFLWGPVMKIITDRQKEIDDMYAEEILREANERAEAMLEKASADIQQEKKKALNDAKDEISDLALAIAAKVVDRELTAADHDRLVEQFIDDLGGSV